MWRVRGSREGRGGGGRVRAGQQPSLQRGPKQLIHFMYRDQKEEKRSKLSNTRHTRQNCKIHPKKFIKKRIQKLLKSWLATDHTFDMQGNVWEGGWWSRAG